MVEFGVALPTFHVGRRGPPIEAFAETAEALHFQSVWAADHIFYRVPNYECIVSIATAGAVTKDIGLGAGVVLPALREPLLLCKQLTSLAEISNGRLRLGVGVGGEYRDEWSALGVNPTERGARTDEFLEIFRLAEQGLPVAYEGRYYQVSAPALQPVSRSPAPVWIGGRSARALARAAEYGDGWLTIWMNASRVAEARRRLGQACESRGRQSPKIGVFLFVSLGAAGDAECSSYMRSLYGPSAGSALRWMVGGSVAQVASGVEPFIAAGAELIVFHIANQDAHSQLEQLAEVVATVNGRAVGM